MKSVYAGSLRYLAVILGLKSVAPLTRLLAIYLAENPGLSEGVDKPRADVAAVREWMGCDDDALYAAFHDLARIGFTDLIIETTAGRFMFEWNFPQIPDDGGVRKAAQEPLRSIYVVAIEGKATKVGITYNPQQRLFGLQQANPTEALILAFVAERKQSIIHKAEKRAHKLLAPYRQGGEWFSASTPVAIDAVMQALVEFE